MTKDLPLDTRTLSLFFKYLQKIFLGYSIMQFPFSILPLIFCSNSKLKIFSFFQIFYNLSFVICVSISNKNKKK